jgi:hypothetical protein
LTPQRDSLALDEARETFAKVAPRQAQVVELRYFGGLNEAQIAEVLKRPSGRSGATGIRQVVVAEPLAKGLKSLESRS